MHGVRCPKCFQILAVKRPVKDARLRCRNCGEVFFGTSDELPDPRATGGRSARPDAPGRPSRPQGPAAPQRTVRPEEPARQPAYTPIRRGTPTWPLYVVAVLVVAIVGIVIAAHYVGTHPRVRELDKHGRVVGDERLSLSEAEEIRRHAQRAAVVPAGQPERRVVGRRPRPTTRGSIRPGDRYGDGPFAEPETVGDPHIRVSDIQPVPGSTLLDWYLIGQVHNSADGCVEGLQLALLARARDEKGNEKTFGKKCTCHYIPPGGSVRFTVRFEGLRQDQVVRLEAAEVSHVRRPDDLVCLPIDSGRCDLPRGQERVTLSGHVKNTTRWRLEKAQVHCDAFTDEGLFAGSGSAALEDGRTDLPVGEERGFRVEFECSEFPAQLVETVDARLVARKAG